MDVRELRYALRALSDTARLRIVQYLAQGEEVSVSDLTRTLRMSQPLASWHLRRLRRAQLVTARRVGRQVLLSLNRSRLVECSRSLLDWGEWRTIKPIDPAAGAVSQAESAVVRHGGEV